MKNASGIKQMYYGTRFAEESSGLGEPGSASSQEGLFPMKISTIVAGAALAASLAAGAAGAAPVSTTLNGTAAAAITGIKSSTPSIGLGTIFTNTLFTAIGSATDDMDVAGVAGAMLTLSPVTATVGSAVNFTSGIGNFAGSVNLASATGSVTNRTVDLYVLGTFTPAGALGTYAPGAMSLTFSFTQTGGAGKAVSGSFSLASPPAAAPISVPEPMSMALFGMGLAGLGVAASRKKA